MTDAEKDYAKKQQELFANHYLKQNDRGNYFSDLLNSNSTLTDIRRVLFAGPDGPNQYSFADCRNLFNNNECGPRCMYYFILFYIFLYYLILFCIILSSWCTTINAKKYCFCDN